MPFHLSPLQEDDILAFAAIDARALENWGVAHAIQNSLPAGTKRQDMIVQFTRKGFGEDREVTWLKLTDVETKEIAAVAKWSFELDVKEVKFTGETIVDASRTDSAPKEPERPNVMLEMGRTMNEFREKYVGTQPRATLNILVTDPKYQRRGAGGMLVQWGCEKADELGIITILGASSAGFGLYLKHGFRVAMEVELDLKPYGVEGTEVRRYMIRQPVAKKP